MALLAGSSFLEVPLAVNQLHYFFRPECRMSARPLDLASALIASVGRAGGFLPSPEQAEALRLALTQPECLVEGGQRTGKTRVAALAVDLFETAGLQVLVAAPTREGAADESRDMGRVVQSLASLLEGSGQGGAGCDAERDAGQALACDVLVLVRLEEMNGALLAQVRAALPDGARLLMLGDASRLPPVAESAGAISALLEEARVPRATLTQVLRQ
jgi:exodeoxyribonuclease V alpha subunit